MSDTVTAVGIRLGVTGKQDVEQGLTEIGNTGAAAAGKTADAFDEASARITRRAEAIKKIQFFMPEANAPQSAGAVRTLMASDEQLQRRSDALRASIDPAAAAQQGFNSRVAEAQALVSRGAISLDEYCAKLSLERRALKDAEEAAGKHGSMLGLNRLQMMEGQSAAIRFSDAVMAGRNPLQAAAVEGHKFVEMLSADDGGMAGGLAKVKALLSPTNLLIGAGAAVMAYGAVEAIAYADSIAKLGAASMGSGRLLGLTGEQLEQVATDAADAGNMTVGAARDIEKGLLGTARSGEVLEKATVLTRDFAAATGVDLKEAATELAKVLANPIAGLEEMAQKYGAVTDAQIEHVKELVEEGKATEAQVAAIDALPPAFAGAADKAQKLGGAVAEIKSEFSQAGEMAGWFFSKAASGFMLMNGMGRRQFLPTAQPGGPANPRAVSEAAATNAYVRQYQRDDRPEITARIGALKQAIADNRNAPAADMRAWTEALAANQHAIDTWVPAATKQNNIIAANTALRKATTPAARAAARAQLEEARAAGEVVTAENVRLRVADRAEGFHNRANAAGQKHAETLAREAEAMRVSAAEAIKVGEAYLTSSVAGLEAEARRKAATDATKKGIDVEAQTRRELTLEIANQIASSAKTVAGLRDETAARMQVLAQVAAGATSVDDMDRALGDEAALRPLLILRTLAHGEVLDDLNKKIDAYTAALKAAHAAEDKMGLEKAMQSSRDAIADATAGTDELGKSPLIRSLGTAQRAANKEADGLHLAPGSQNRIDLVTQREHEAAVRYQADQAKFRHDTLEGQRDSLELSQREGELAGATDSTRTAELDKLRLQQQLRRQFPDMAKADVDQLLDGVGAIDAQNEKTRLLQASWAELHEAGDRFLDDLLHPNGDGLKSLLKDIEQELEKMALINPLKNLLMGESNPTLGGLFKSLLGGGSGGFNPGDLDTSVITGIGGPVSLPHNAAGSQDWSGGRTWLNENGPEIADLPGGTRIYPAAESRRMMQAANENGGGSTRVKIELNTPLFTATVASTADQRVSAATPGIVAGGAQLAGVNAGRAQRRRLGRR